jgi:glyoxylase-like metal-dependent hydrolase (beta-lactamase superfamily II)
MAYPAQAPQESFMPSFIRSSLVLAALAVSAPASPGNETATAPPPAEVARGVWLVPGGIRPDRQPDGNSVIFAAPDGLVVVDTGRHSWHRAAIQSLASTRRAPIIAIVNTHWHLDHVSGNPGLRKAHPALRVYASDAIDGALAGFFPASAREAAGYLDDPQVPQATRDDIRGDLQAIENGNALRPDEVVAASGDRILGGRKLRINLAPDAATAGDVWIYDARSRVVVLGDLVTLPAPFLDTACPEGWKNALQQVAATPFELAIPGHGAPLTRAGLQLYRSAFEAFIGCSSSARSAADCASDWTDSVGSLLGEDPRERQQAQEMAAYYTGMLRTNGGRSKYCASAPQR